jgi:hypothetical protein
MNVQELKEFIEKLPKEYLSYDVVISEELVVDECADDIIVFDNIINRVNINFDTNKIQLFGYDKKQM